ASCARVVQQAPDDVDALVERGRLALLAGQPAEGEQWLTRAVAAAPGNREAQYSLYQCLERQGKQEEARRHLDQANQITADLRWMEALNKKLAEAPDDAAVRPGESIQEALEQVALAPSKGTVRVHAGVYRPKSPGQAFLFFNARHDGITLVAVGDVTLTAANPQIADRRAAGYPAVVNHVVYFGDGVSARTILRGFKITGANGFV